MRGATANTGTLSTSNSPGDESVDDLNEIKKSSYYVWFLGAREVRGLRGPEYIASVIRGLLEREHKTGELFKMTIQVSPKGLKIIHNMPGAPNHFDKSGKSNAVKLSIPHHAVSSVFQKVDVVGCMLIYDNHNKCPLTVQAYRCDSVKTANVLHSQLNILIERPENQKKVAEMESKLSSQKCVQASQKKQVAPTGPDSTIRSKRESESSGSSSVGHPSRASSAEQSTMSTLISSLASELKEKIGPPVGSLQGTAPLLLPPRDYDTVHRQKGNLSDINTRRCLNTHIVGVNATPNHLEGATSLKPSAHAKGKFGSSGGSSGIGSDHAPSPDHEHHDTRFIGNQSSSDEEWNAEPYKRPAVIGQPGCSGSGQRGRSWSNRGGDHSLPRAQSYNSSGSTPTSPARRGPVNHVNDADVAGREYRRSREYPPQPQPEQPLYPDFQRPRRLLPNVDNLQSETNTMVNLWKRKNAEDRQRSPSPTTSKSVTGSLTPRDRFNDAKEKFRSLEKEKQEEQERQEKALLVERRRSNQPIEQPISPAVVAVVRSRLRKSWSRSGDSEEDLDEQQGYSAHDESYGQPRRNDERGYHQNLRREPSYLQSQSHESTPDSEDFPVRVHKKMDAPYSRREEQQRQFDASPSRRNLDSPGYSSMPSENIRQVAPAARLRPRRDLSPDVRPRLEVGTSPTEGNTPRHSPRKLPTLSQSQLDELKKRFKGKVPRRYLNTNPVPLAESDSEIPLERYRSPTRMNPPPRPSPRHQQRYPTPNSDEEDEHRDYRAMMHQDHRNFASRSQFENDMKRRSAYESIVDEQRRNSHELAKEFKRRSFQEPGPNMDNGLGYQELDERERYPGLDRETARVRPTDESAVPTTSPRYRHSYAEPFHQFKPAGQPTHEMLHRTNSSLSSGRIGMASIHPY